MKKFTKLISILLVFIVITLIPSNNLSTFSKSKTKKSYKFNFTEEKLKGYTNIEYDETTGVPIFSEDIGYGFTDETSISISGMEPARMLKTGYWDAASLVPIENYATYEDSTWT
jgi:hypothetical protein